MSFLDSASDPKKIRALKLFLIGTLAAGALASLVAKPLTVPVPSWAIAPLWTLSYGLMAVAAWLVWKRDGLRAPSLTACAIGLALNLVWRAQPSALLGAAMDMAMLATLILFARRNFMAALTFLLCMTWSMFVSIPMIGF